MPTSFVRTCSRSTGAWRPGGVFDLEIVEQSEGFWVFRAVGRDAHEVFKGEPGGHRVQRIPPTEKRGRVQTSSITVAVMPEPNEVECRIDERDVDMQAVRSSGAGGQNVNKVSSAVILTHRPTGIKVRCETQRSQIQNKRSAFATLRARILEAERQKGSAARAADRKQQVGLGERSDKVRTYRFQDGIVTDHNTGKKASLERILKGWLEDLV